MDKETNVPDIINVRIKGSYSATGGKSSNVKMNVTICHFLSELPRAHDDNFRFLLDGTSGNLASSRFSCDQGKCLICLTDVLQQLLASVKTCCYAF